MWCSGGTTRAGGEGGVTSSLGDPLGLHASKQGHSVHRAVNKFNSMNKLSFDEMKIDQTKTRSKDATRGSWPYY